MPKYKPPKISKSKSNQQKKTEKYISDVAIKRKKGMGSEVSVTRMNQVEALIRVEKLLNEREG